MRSLDHLPAIVSDDDEVDAGLKELGLSREIIRQVAYAAAGARAEALPIDPSSAPGMLSYIFGVRHIRLLLQPLGWRLSRVGNVESTISDDLGIQICFQNVDIACSAVDPKAISGKGAASRQLVSDGNFELFPLDPASRIAPIGATPTVWVICVSADDHSIRAEVSCPRSFEGNQFEGFVRRLWVVDDTLEPQANRQPDDDEGLDFDVAVTRK